eukprot:8131648-Pyramimonas_sp.AAC.1
MLRLAHEPPPAWENLDPSKSPHGTFSPFMSNNSGSCTSERAGHSAAGCWSLSASKNCTSPFWARSKKRLGTSAACLAS